MDHNMLLDAHGDVQEPFTSSPAKEPCDLCTLIYMPMWQKRCDDLSWRKGEQKGHSRREWALIDAACFLILGDTFKHDVAGKSKFGKVRKLGTKAIRFNFKIYRICILFRVHKLFISVIAQQHKHVWIIIGFSPSTTKVRSQLCLILWVFYYFIFFPPTFFKLFLTPETPSVPGQHNTDIINNRHSNIRPPKGFLRCRTETHF